MNKELISRIVKPALSESTAKTFHHRDNEGLRPTPRKAKKFKVRSYPHKLLLSLIFSRCSA